MKLFSKEAFPQVVRPVKELSPNALRDIVLVIQSKFDYSIDIKF